MIFCTKNMHDVLEIGTKMSQRHKDLQPGLPGQIISLVARPFHSIVTGIFCFPTQRRTRSPFLKAQSATFTLFRNADRLIFEALKWLKGRSGSVSHYRHNCIVLIMRTNLNKPQKLPWIRSNCLLVYHIALEPAKF